MLNICILTLYRGNVRRDTYYCTVISNEEIVVKGSISTGQYFRVSGNVMRFSASKNDLMTRRLSFFQDIRDGSLK